MHWQKINSVCNALSCGRAHKLRDDPEIKDLARIICRKDTRRCDAVMHAISSPVGLTSPGDWISPTLLRIQGGGRGGGGGASVCAVPNNSFVVGRH